MIQIEKGVKKVGKPNAKYNWQAMKVGDSILVPEDTSTHSALTAAKQWSKRNNKGWKFSSGTDEEGKLRIWRIKQSV